MLEITGKLEGLKFISGLDHRGDPNLIQVKGKGITGGIQAFPFIETILDHFMLDRGPPFQKMAGMALSAHPGRPLKPTVMVQLGHLEIQSISNVLVLDPGT